MRRASSSQASIGSGLVFGPIEFAQQRGRPGSTPSVSDSFGFASPAAAEFGQGTKPGSRLQSLGEHEEVHGGLPEPVGESPDKALVVRTKAQSIVVAQAFLEANDEDNAIPEEE